MLLIDLIQIWWPENNFSSLLTLICSIQFAERENYILLLSIYEYGLLPDLNNKVIAISVSKSCMLQFLVLFTLGTQLSLNWKFKFKISTALKLPEEPRISGHIFLLKLVCFISNIFCSKLRTPLHLTANIFWSSVYFGHKVDRKIWKLWTTDCKLVHENYDIIVLVINCLKEDVFPDDYIKIVTVTLW